MDMINKIKKKYRDVPLPVKASFWFVIVNIFNKGIAFITTPVFTRIMTQKAYGITSLYNSWFAIISIVATFEFSTGVFNKAMIKYSDDRDSYTSSMLVLTSYITIAIFALYLAFRKRLNTALALDTSMMILMFLEIFFTSAMNFWSIRERFEYRYKQVVIVTLVTNLLATTLSVVLVCNFPGNLAFFKVLGLTIVHVVIYFFVFIKIFHKGRTFINIQYWLYSIKYNLPLLPHYLSQQVLNQSDRIMISNLCGSTQTAKYSLSYQIASIMQLITNAVHVTFMPWTYQKLSNSDYKPIGVRAVQIEILVASASLIFSLFAPEFIMILGGKAYLDAVYIVPPVAMSVLFITIYSFFGNIEFYFEKTQLIMVASCITALVNIILNSVFIPVTGYIAAGYTTMFCYILYAGVHYFFMVKICKDNNIDNPYPGKLMWGIALLFSVVSIMMTAFYKFYLIRYVVILILISIVIIYFWKNKNIILDNK